MNQNGKVIAIVNLFLAGILILLGVGWSFVQKGCHWNYEREAKAFFEQIEEKEISYFTFHTPKSKFRDNFSS